MKQDFIDFYDRWIEKGKCYQIDDLSDCFDKFVTLYILFNSQYNYLAGENANDFSDRHKATNLIKQFIDFLGYRFFVISYGDVFFFIYFIV